VLQFPDELQRFGQGLRLPVKQLLHLKWDAPSFSPRGNSIVLPAFQSIELLRDYRKAEQAIAKRWTTPFRMIKVGGAFGNKMVIEKGVEPGDMVVTDGQLFLYPGAKVRAVDAAKIGSGPL